MQSQQYSLRYVTDCARARIGRQASRAARLLRSSRAAGMGPLRSWTTKRLRNANALIAEPDESGCYQRNRRQEMTNADRTTRFHLR